MSLIYQLSDYLPEMSNKWWIMCCLAQNRYEKFFRDDAKVNAAGIIETVEE